MVTAVLLKLAYSGKLLSMLEAVYFPQFPVFCMVFQKHRAQLSVSPVPQYCPEFRPLNIDGPIHTHSIFTNTCSMCYAEVDKHMAYTIVSH